jgi:hypothetical protein
MDVLLCQDEMSQHIGQKIQASNVIALYDKGSDYFLVTTRPNFLVKMFGFWWTYKLSTLSQNVTEVKCPTDGSLAGRNVGVEMSHGLLVGGSIAKSPTPACRYN